MAVLSLEQGNKCLQELQSSTGCTRLFHVHIYYYNYILYHAWITGILTGKDPDPLIPGEVRNKPSKFSYTRSHWIKDIRRINTPEVVIHTSEVAVIKPLCVRWENVEFCSANGSYRWLSADNLSLKSFNQDLKSCRGIEVVAQIKNVFAT